MIAYLPDHHRVFDVGDHFDSAAAFAADIDIDIEHALQALYPAHACVRYRPISASVETTYAQDLPGLAACLATLAELHIELERRLARLDASYRIERHFLKLRFDDFTATTIERALPEGVALTGYRRLCEEAWARCARPIRLLGLGVRLSDSAGSGPEQRDLFAAIAVGTEPSATSSRG